MGSSVIIESKEFPPSENARLTFTSWSQSIVKGQLNKLRSRLPSLGQSQESSRSAMATVTSYKLVFGAVIGGPFTVGETITGGTSLATGVVTHVGALHVYYTLTAGVFVAGEAVTGGTSAASGVVAVLTVPQLVGQIVKIPEDNVAGLMVTVESNAVFEVVSDMEASQANLQLMWTTAGIAAVRDTTVKTAGAASIKLDATTDPGPLYTHLFSELPHGAVAGGPFVLNETVTGGVSGATATVALVRTDEIHLVGVVGAFQASEVITGSVSAATATTTSTVRTTEDWSGGKTLALDMRVNAKDKMQLQVAISDGVNSASVLLQPGVILTWSEQRIDLDTLAAGGLPAAVDLTAITQITMQPINKNSVAINVDNMRVIGTPGTLGLRFYDMGAVLPVSGVATLGGGTAVALGDLGISSETPSVLVTAMLSGGKELLVVDDFSHGAAKEIPANTLLTPGNYYAIVFEWSDVDVIIYGADPSLGVDYYVDGYAFTAPDTATALTSLGALYDCMFSLWTAQPTWVRSITVTADEEAGGGAYHLVVEDASMGMRVLARGRAYGTTASFDLGPLPAYLPSGGKCELYYSDVAESAVTVITVTAAHWSASFDSYTADP